MAVRVRASGEVVCAAMHPEQEGDRYIDDGLHYRLAVELRVLVTEPMILEEGEGLGGHSKHGLWWWRGEEDDRAAIDQFYREDPEDDAEPEPPELTEEERQKRPPAHVGVGMPGWIGTVLAGAGLLCAFIGALVSPKAALACVVAALPFYLFPRQLGSQSFALHEVMLFLTAAAVYDWLTATARLTHKSSLLLALGVGIAVGRWVSKREMVVWLKSLPYSLPIARPTSPCVKPETIGGSVASSRARCTEVSRFASRTHPI